MNLDRMTDALSDLLTRFGRSRNPKALLRDDTLDMAERLLDLMIKQQERTGAVEVRTVNVLAWLHWYRHQLLQETGAGSDDLERALSLFSTLMPVAPDVIPDPVKAYLAAPGQQAAVRAVIATDRAADLVEAYERTGQLDLLDTAVTLMSQVLDEEAGDDALRTMTKSNLAYALLLRFDRVHRDADLQASIKLARHAVAGQVDNTEHALSMSHLANALQTRYQITTQLTDLEEAIQLLHKALDATTPATRDHAMYLNNLSNALQDRFTHTGRLADLNEAVRVAERAVQGLAEGDRLLPAALSNLGITLHRRFERTGQRDDLASAIAAHQRAVSVTGTDDPYLPLRLLNLASSLRAQSELGDRQATLAWAIEVARQAVETIPSDHPQRSAILDTLAALLSSRFRVGLDLADLEESVQLHRQAIAAATDDPDRAKYLSNLATALQERSRWAGEPGDLDAAVVAARQAVDEPRLEIEDRGIHLANLGTVLFQRFDNIGNRDDLDEAITATEQALTCTAITAPAYARYQKNLGAMLIRRFEMTGNPADLDGALNNLEESVDRTPDSHAEFSDRLSVLSVALSHRFELTGHGADLDMSIEVARRAIDAVPASHPDIVAARANYAILLWTRHQWMRQHADLDTAIDEISRAIQAAPSGHPHLTAMLTNRSMLLHERFELSNAQSDLDLAVADSREGLAATASGHPDRAVRQSNLGILLRTRFTVTGDRADIDEAIDVSRAAVDATANDGIDRARALSSLGYALRIRFESTGDGDDIDAAIAVTERAVPMSADGSADRAGMLTNLGIALWTRFQLTGRIEDLNNAVASRRTAANTAAGPVRTRIAAAAAWGRWALEAGDVESALEGYTFAVDLLPQAAWHGLDERTRQDQLAEMQGLAGAAASCAIASHQPERAVELLEQGRSIIWTHALHLRSEPTLLTERDPALADRLQELRRELDTAPLDTAELSVADGPSEFGREAAAERRRRAAREFDELLQEIRCLDGFEHFFRTTPFAQLRDAAADGPVVILNTSDLGSHALIIRRDDTEGGAAAPVTAVDVVPLPGASASEALAWANRFVRLIGRDQQVRRGFLERERDRHTVFDLLDWLWDAVAEPVLASLGLADAPAGDATLPRVWWCPTSVWTVVPIHAAGRHPRNRNKDADPWYTLDGRVISSYTPTLTALIAARSTSPSAGPTEDDAVGMLAIGVPEAPGTAPLPAVDEEMAVAERYFRAPNYVRQLRSDAATGQNVKQALPNYPWVHFACHGHQDPDDPSRSALWLYDGPLTVDDLVQLRHNRAEFAFLSACQTTTGDTRLLDEAVHLAAAFRLLGYRHVIASLWHIRDAPAPEIADAVYARLTDTGHNDARVAALALHDAVVKLRNTYPDKPLVWAPYTHSGP